VDLPGDDILTIALFMQALVDPQIIARCSRMCDPDRRQGAGGRKEKCTGIRYFLLVAVEEQAEFWGLRGNIITAAAQSSAQWQGNNRSDHVRPNHRGKRTCSTSCTGNAALESEEREGVEQVVRDHRRGWIEGCARVDEVHLTQGGWSRRTVRYVALDGVERHLHAQHVDGKDEMTEIASGSRLVKHYCTHCKVHTYATHATTAHSTCSHHLGHICLDTHTYDYA